MKLFNSQSVLASVGLIVLSSASAFADTVVPGAVFGMGYDEIVAGKGGVYTIVNPTMKLADERRAISSLSDADGLCQRYQFHGAAKEGRNESFSAFVVDEAKSYSRDELEIDAELVLVEGDAVVRRLSTGSPIRTVNCIGSELRLPTSKGMIRSEGTIASPNGEAIIIRPEMNVEGAWRAISVKSSSDGVCVRLGFRKATSNATYEADGLVFDRDVVTLSSTGNIAGIGEAGGGVSFISCAN